MKQAITKRQFLATAAFSLAGSTCNAQQSTAVADQHAAIGLKTTRESFRRTTNPDAQWFGDAGLGLFVHWGISSVHGGIDLSWGMIANKPWDQNAKHPESLCTPEEYFGLAKRFHPDGFNPNSFLKSAKEAGFRYAVMTTRHHDGFAMWPSDAGVSGVKQIS